jgi:hypothetical protein
MKPGELSISRRSNLGPFDSNQSRKRRVKKNWQPSAGRCCAVRSCRRGLPGAIFAGQYRALSRGPWGRLVPTRERIQKNPRIGQSFVMRRISGRCQRGIRYALWALCEATTMEVLEYCYSWPSEDRGQRKNRARAACLAARKMAIVVGRHGPTATDGGSRPTICLRCTEKPHQKPSAKCEHNRVF